jgi:crotonobetainyl-CoA:carnitine CoA-transferase CaiB-like acyl-CoA transferase
VDVALYEPLMFILGDLILNYTATGHIQQRVGNGSGSASPRGIYQAADGKWLSIAGSNQTIALRLFVAMGRPEFRADPRFATNVARMEHNEELQEHVRAWVALRPRHEVLADLEAHEVVAAAVNDAKDIVADPHFQERTLVDLLGTVLGAVQMPGPVLHMGSYAGPVYDGVPAIGEHTHAVLPELLGLNAEQLDELGADGIVGPTPVRAA